MSASQTNPAKIQVEGLSYSIDGSELLKQVDCEFETRQVHVILGQNGAGKSTLLNCLSHELLPTEGSIIWNGQPLESISYVDLALQRAVLSQSNELAFSFTVQELVELGEAVQQRASVQAKLVVEAVLHVCDMTHLRHRDYLTLSGGEQKRAQLARVLAQIWPEQQGEKESTPNATPPVQNLQQLKIEPIFNGQWLFLDEWTAGLDIKHQQRLGRYFKQWAKRGLGIIMVLHDISFAAQLADRCLILKEGQVFADGEVTSTLTQATLQEAMEMTVRVEIDPQNKLPIITPLLESF
ncbi:MAG: heme transport system ATP-binding protein [Thiomicrorhabdus sp.]|nr:MAG: heme transport system ATP-binding protein [Thiomicrorhabdus sp.]